jgi:hypothetical protein
LVITATSRWKGNREDALRIGKQIAPILKNHGATAMRLGYCYSGEYTGQLLAVVNFPDWATYGRAMQAISEDSQYQGLLSEALKIAELQVCRAEIINLDDHRLKLFDIRGDQSPPPRSLFSENPGVPPPGFSILQKSPLCGPRLGCQRSGGCPAGLDQAAAPPTCRGNTHAGRTVSPHIEFGFAPHTLT